MEEGQILHTHPSLPARSPLVQPTEQSCCSWHRPAFLVPLTGCLPHTQEKSVLDPRDGNEKPGKLQGGQHTGEEKKKKNPCKESKRKGASLPGWSRVLGRENKQLNSSLVPRPTGTPGGSLQKPTPHFARGLQDCKTSFTKSAFNSQRGSGDLQHCGRPVTA